MLSWSIIPVGSASGIASARGAVSEPATTTINPAAAAIRNLRMKSPSVRRFSITNIGTTSRDLHYQNSGPDYRSVRINPAARRGTALGVFPLDLVDSTDEEIERLVEVRDGSLANDPFSASSDQCPLCIRWRPSAIPRQTDAMSYLVDVLSASFVPLG